MFKKRYTKWEQLGSFSFSSKDYVTFIRVNKKNGLPQFKTIRVNWFPLSMGCVSSILPANFMDVQKQWDKMFN